MPSYTRDIRSVSHCVVVVHSESDNRDQVCDNRGAASHRGEQETEGTTQKRRWGEINTPDTLNSLNCTVDVNGIGYLRRFLVVETIFLQYEPATFPTIEEQRYTLGE